MKWENTLNSLIVPQILTPGQYSDERRGDSAMRPLKLLMVAILEDALICLDKYANAKSRAGRLIYQEAEQWLDREGGNSLFSFGAVCDILGVESDYLRVGIDQWRGKQSRGGSARRLKRRSPVARERSISSGRAHRSREKSLS
jgi:hypothetical protein